MENADPRRWDLSPHPLLLRGARPAAPSLHFGGGGAGGTVGECCFRASLEKSKGVKLQLSFFSGLLWLL